MPCWTPCSPSAINFWVRVPMPKPETLASIWNDEEKRRTMPCELDRAQELIRDDGAEVKVEGKRARPRCFCRRSRLTHQAHELPDRRDPRQWTQGFYRGR